MKMQENSEKPPYVYYKFLGINSFIKTLDDSNTDYTLFDEKYDDLYDRYKGILTGDDSIKSGLLTRDGQHVFFVEVGIKITRSFSSYFVYIFDHHPLTEDFDFIIRGLESLVSENVDKIDPSELADKIKENKKGGHMIN